MNDHRHFNSDIVPADSMPDGSEEVPLNQSAHDESDVVATNPPTHDSSADSANRDPAASAPTQPGDVDARAPAAVASAPTQPGDINAPASRDLDIAASAPTQPGHLDVPAAMEPSRSSQPAPPAAHDPTRTSQPDRPAAHDPTRTSQPGAPVAATTPPLLSQPGVPQLRNPARYHILGEHGRGGLGKVSRAHDIELGRDVAIKELLSRSAMHEVRFMREALITARLEHPGIVPVHEAGRWPDGTPFYAMKLVAGRPLRDLLAERKTVDERLALLHHVIAVAEAIAYAHGRRIIHRDLKPGNVIIGDFGETVVIDWGLAKDLSSSEDSTSSGGPLPVSRDDGLTSAGAVLGTPAYMAPEQRRGEPVDQRADVYAIGVMLWELGSLERVPPSDRGQRHRALRHAGIDPDLIAIIDKTLDAEPDRRYPDAGALATDLKYFKAGARIASRRYSLWGLLTHWTRRHRLLALSAAAVAALAVIGIAVYVRNIASERDRADAALARTEAAKNDLTLEHAELLLHSDPTSAFAGLSKYHGNDQLRRQRLLAEAVGLGVARNTFQPHTDTIWFLLGDNTGTIVSLGEDGRLVSTRNGKSEILATDISLSARPAYSPSSGILAYVTSPTGVALLQLRDRTLTRIPTKSAMTPQFSPDGRHLAITDDHGELIVFSILDSGVSEIFRTPLPGTSQIRFMTPSRIISRQDETLRVIALDSHQAAPDTVRIPGITAIDVRETAIAVGTSDGTIELLSPNLSVLSVLSLCRTRVNAARFVPRRNQLAFSCSDGYSGLIRFDPSLTGLTILDTFPTRGSAQVVPDATGRYIALTDDSLIAYIFDIETRLTHRYKGHTAQPSYIAPPTTDFPYVITGDMNGIVRLWNPPTSHTRLVLQSSHPLFSLAISRDSQILLANGHDTLAHGFNIATESSFQLSGGNLFSARIAPDSSSMLTYGYDGTIRVWRTRDLTLSRSLDKHQGQIGEVDYIDSKHIVSVGEDGQMLQWSLEDDTAFELFKCSSALRRLEILHYNQHIVAYDQRGGLWDIAPNREIAHVRDSDGTKITVLRASPDGKFVAIGTDVGMVDIYDTSNWHIIRSERAGGNIRQIVFDPLDRDLLVASEATHGDLGGVRVIVLKAQRAYHWHNINVAIRDVDYASDGNTLGFVTTDGSIWLYSIPRDIWNYTNYTNTDTLEGRFSPDGSLFATIDKRGSVILHDVTLP